MILAKLNQPEFEYDIHSLIKAFFPEENVSATAEDKKYEEEITLQFQVEYEPQQIKIEWKEKNQESHDRSFPVDFLDRTETKNELKQNFYQILSEITGKKLDCKPTAVGLSYVSKKNQNYIAVAIDSQQSSPSQAQAKRMRELDEKKLLNGDVIDGIMMEDKKEVDKVILTGAELSKYFGKETTPREMKDQIIKLLDDWKGQQKEHEKPEKKTEQEK